MKRLGLAALVLSLFMVGAAFNGERPDGNQAGPGRLAAKSGIAMDLDTGAVLFQKAASQPRYPASTAKVLTALVALDTCGLAERVTIGDEANRAPLDSSKAGLRYGETLSVGDLLHAMLIASGNDAAYALAVHVGRHAAGDTRLPIDDALGLFIRMMNERAEKAGARHSNFTGPDGYHQAGQASTARDMALITRAAMKYGEFRQVVSMRTYRLPDIKGGRGQGNTKRLLVNTNRLLDPGSPFYCSQAEGIKTGHTAEAGYCLISYSSSSRHQIITVVMDSTERDVWEDSKRLLKWSLKQR